MLVGIWYVGAGRIQQTDTAEQSMTNMFHGDQLAKLQV
jgi:hypothetical protein